MNKEELIKPIARELDYRLPFWKKHKFRKWMKSNNWDVKDVYTQCLREAKYIVEEENRFKF